MGLAHPDVIKGKFYLGKASDIIRLVSWFNEKLKQRGCGGYVKKLERTDGRPVLRAVFFRLGGLLLYELVL